MRFALCTLLLLPAVSGAQPLFIDGTPEAGGMPEPAPLAPYATSPSLYPTGLVWPIDRALGDDAFLSNYVDDDPASGSMIDYEGGRDHLYDGHRGTDISIDNFRVQDRGVWVLAAAPGTVLATTYGFGDRNTSTPYPDGGNGLSIQHDDGTRAFYWHVRTNSIVVEPGERVEAGQPLAYVGSAGWTPIPHLHFELSDARDPWEGSFHTLPSLWAEQPAYVGDAPIWMMEADVFTPEAVGGSLSGLNQRRLKERVQAPAVYGADEANVYAWTHIQANVGDTYSARLIDPSGVEVDIDGVFINQKTRYGWYAHVFPMPADAEHGLWRIAFTSGERTLREVAFEIGATTEYGPRVALPSSAFQQMVAAHSFRLDGSAQSLPLGVSGLSGPVTYSLSDAPAYASLDGETLRIASGADQAYRWRLFHVLATDAEARTDTLFIQAVHPERPFNPISTDAEPLAPEAGGIGIGLAPHPVRHRTSVTVTMARSGPLRVVLLDARGREAAVMASGDRAAGTHSLPVDVAALGLGAGVYAIRAIGVDGQAVAPLVVVR